MGRRAATCRDRPEIVIGRDQPGVVADRDHLGNVPSRKPDCPKSTHDGGASPFKTSGNMVFRRALIRFCASVRRLLSVALPSSCDLRPYGSDVLIPAAF